MESKIYTDHQLKALFNPVFTVSGWFSRMRGKSLGNGQKWDLQSTWAGGIYSVLLGGYCASPQIVSKLTIREMDSQV